MSEFKSRTDLIIHIGWPKTGSTFLQRMLVLNDDLLRERGILYPELELWSTAHHHACGLLITHDDPLIPPPKGTIDDVLALADDPKAQKVILSSEGFCRALSIHPEASAALREKFSVKIVAVLRDPMMWANSMLNEYAKARLFFTGEMDSLDLGRSMIRRHCNYADQLELWAENFGLNNISVLAMREGNDMVYPVLKAMGVDPAGFQTPGASDSNRSIGLAELQIIAWLCRSEADLALGRKIALMTRITSERGGTIPNLLSRDEQAFLAMVTDRDTLELARNWLGSPPPFRGLRLPPQGSADALDSPDLMKVAVRVLVDEPELLSALRACVRLQAKQAKACPRLLPVLRP